MPGIRRFFWRAWQYAKYLAAARTSHGIHSPFVFRLNEEVFRNKSRFYAYFPLETLRNSLRLDNSLLEIRGMGAAARPGKIKVADIAGRSVRNQKYAELLFRLVQDAGSHSVLELGTSLGLTTLYLSYACDGGRVTTVEGEEALCEFASRNFQRSGRKNIRSVRGRFEDVLQAELDEGHDFIFFDGNHEEEATLAYFRQALGKKTGKSIFVFDDIHWSPSMLRAWEKIKEEASVTLTIDIFEMGIVFFMPRVEKEHFVIRF